METALKTEPEQPALEDATQYKFKYYYIREPFCNIPVITLCTVKRHNSHDLVSLGVAVCSDWDMPNKKLGKRIALGRAMRNITDGCVFSQYELKNCSIVREVLNSQYDAYSTVPWHVNTFLEFMEFELYE